MKGCSDRSSLPPKPPPTALGMMRTWSGASPRIGGDLVAVHIGRLGAGEDLDAVADAAGIAGLGLDIGVLDEAGLEAPSTTTSAAASAASTSPRTTRPRVRTLPGRSACTRRRAGRERRLDRRQRGSGVPVTGKVARSSAAIAVVIADDRRDRLAAKARLALGEHRLVGEGRDDAEAVEPGSRRR